jgi:hypothetical protein
VLKYDTTSCSEITVGVGAIGEFGLIMSGDGMIGGSITTGAGVDAGAGDFVVVGVDD